MRYDCNEIDALVLALNNNGVAAEPNEERSGVLMTGDLGHCERVIKVVLGAADYPTPHDGMHDYVLYLD